MENASKALIIAGAILISIVLIGVGVLIVNSANNLIGEGTSSMTKQERDAFNGQFERYEGRQNGSNIRTLISAVNTNNLYYGTENTEKLVTINEEYSTSEQLTSYRSKINTAKHYNVVLSYNETTGLINAITITDSTSATPAP